MFSKEMFDFEKNFNVIKIFVKDCVLGSECFKFGFYCNE